VVRVDRGRLLQRAIGREAGTREGRCEGLRERVELNEILRMVKQNVIAETSVAVNSNVLRSRAKVLLSGLAQGAPSTTAPCIDNASITDADARRIRSQFIDLADDFVAENARERNRAREISLPPLPRSRYP